MSRNRIVMLAGPGESTNILYHALKSSCGVEKVILEAPVSKTEFLKRRVRRLGLWKVFGQVIFQALAVPWLRRTSTVRLQAIRQACELNNAALDEANVLAVKSVNSDEAISLLKALKPDLVVINGTRIISKRVLQAVEARFINIHAGITPLYRGVHGAYWALVENNLPACGVTVHFVDEGIDTGGILAQAVIQPEPEDNFVTYPLLQLAAGIALIKEVISDVLAGRAQLQAAPSGQSVLRTHPTIFEYLNYRIGRGVK